MDKDKVMEESGDIKFSYFKTIRRVFLFFFLGFSVYLTISTITLIFLTKSSKELKIPDVVGKRYIDVHNGLSRKGLRIDLKFINVFDIEDGVILNQYPEAGKIVNENSVFKLVVSRSKLNVEVPNLVGVELPVAINKLRNLHAHGKAISIGTGIISYIPSEKVADNIVIGQSPKANEIIMPDRKINLLVSSGNIKNDNKMPDVEGQKIDLSYDLLSSKGLIINEKIIITNHQNKSGKIIYQYPPKNRGIKKGDRVILKVLWYPVREHAFMSYEKVDYQIPGDQKKGFFEAVVEDSSTKRVRFADNATPGSRIAFIFHRTGNAKIYITNNKKKIRIISIDVNEFN